MIQKLITKCNGCRTYTLHFLYLDCSTFELWVCGECKTLKRVDKFNVEALKYWVKRIR